MFLLDYKSGVPIYEQLKQKTLELIMLGEMSPGDKMPSVRSLARELGVNPNTIQKAYQDLERDGVIVSISGKGSFINSTLKHSPQQIDKSLDNLKKAVREARLYGISKADCEEVVRAEYATE